MPKSRKSSKKGKNPGVGIDFKKAKHKVGKKLPRAQNDTETEIKSGKLFLRESSIATDKSQLATTSRNNTLRELLSLVKHYSEKTRIKAINGLIELIREYPSEARPHAAEIIAATSGLVSDPDQACRDAFVTFLRASLFPAIGERAVHPFMAYLMAHTCSAMTHLSAAVRDSGIEAINVLLEFRPDLVGKGYFTEVAEHYAEALSRSNRGRSLTAGSLKNLASICEGCHNFLRATLPHVGIECQTGSTVREANKSITRRELASEARDGLKTPIILNRQLCSWGRNRSQLNGEMALEHAGSTVKEQNMIGESIPGVALGQRLVSLLLDCWEECGLVSEDEAIDPFAMVNGPSGTAKNARGAAEAQNARSKLYRSVGVRCGVAILRCCTLLISKFKSDVVSDESSAKIFEQIFPTYPLQTGCEVSTAAADLISTAITQLHEANRPFTEDAVTKLASWSGRCLESDFLAGTRVSLAILSFASPELQCSMLRHMFDVWTQWDAPKKLKGNSGELKSPDASIEIKNVGLKMMLKLVQPPFDTWRLSPLDDVLALWVGEIPSQLWKVQKATSLVSAQYTFKLGLSVLLCVSQFAGSKASRRLLPSLCAELDQLSMKIVPLFSLKIKEKTRPGPLTKMPEPLQVLAVDVLFNLPRLDNVVVGAVSSSLSHSSLTLAPRAIASLLDLVYFKSEYGDPEKVWSLIFSVLERGAGDREESTEYALEHIARLATHCSPPNMAIKALVPALLSKGTEPATCGALFFLNHCLTVYDGRELDIDDDLVQSTMKAICAGSHANEDTGLAQVLGRDVIVRLIHQVPRVIPAILSHLSAEEANENDLNTTSSIVAGHVVHALRDLDLTEDVRDQLVSCRALVPAAHRKLHDLLYIL